MELYNSLIRKIPGLTGASAPVSSPYDPARCWDENAEFELIMQRDAAFELGGSGRPSANFTCVTSDETLVPRDEVTVIGPDLPALKADSPFARLVLLQTGPGVEPDPQDSEACFRAIQELDFIKYKIYPKGYMIRSSSESNREQVRIEKAALKKGMSFSRIGNAMIRRYKANPNVLRVHLYFITAPDADYAALQKCASQVHDITMTLSKILEGMPTDCHSCSMKPLCDEVEGMRELHFGKSK